MWTIRCGCAADTTTAAFASWARAVQRALEALSVATASHDDCVQTSLRQGGWEGGREGRMAGGRAGEKEGGREGGLRKDGKRDPHLHACVIMDDWYEPHVRHARRAVALGPDHLLPRAGLCRAIWPESRERRAHELGAHAVKGHAPCVIHVDDLQCESTRKHQRLYSRREAKESASET
jgi:hypothetical protein